MSTDDLFLFIGASGKQCTEIIPYFYPRCRLRLAVNSTTSLKRLQEQYPKAEVVQADIEQPAQCSGLFKGVTSVYYTGPTYRPHEAQMGFNVIDATVAETRETGFKFKHFVYSSAHCPQLSKMLNHGRKREVEEYLAESPLNWTILQPTHFGDASITRLLEPVKAATAAGEQPVFKALFNPNRPFAYAFIKDHAEAAAKVLQEREPHYFATYDLCSTETMSYVDFANKVGNALPNPVTYNIEVLNYATAIDLLSLVNFGTKDVDQRCRDAAERMLLFYDTRGLPGNPNVLEWLLGRKPTSIKDAVMQQLEEFGL